METFFRSFEVGLSAFFIAGMFIFLFGPGIVPWPKSKNKKTNRRGL